MATVLLLATALALLADPASADHSRWGAPSLIESDDRGDAEAPKVAVDSDGHAIAVWHQSDGTWFNIWANRFVPEAGWGTASLLEMDDLGDNMYPQLAMDAQGTAIVVWDHSTPSNPFPGCFDAIYSNRFVAGVGWGTATPVVTGTREEDCLFVRDIAVDERGNGIALWDGDGGVWASRFESSTGWGAATRIGSGDHPRLAVEADGTAIAVWHAWEETRTRFDIWANHFVSGVGWGAATLIEANDTGSVDQPSISMDSDGSAVVVWTQYDGTQGATVMANRYAPNGGWGVATAVSPALATDRLHVVIDGPGTAVAAWFGWGNGDWRTSEKELLVNRYRAGFGWEADPLILRGFGTPYVYADLALGTDSKGNLFVVFHSGGTPTWPEGVYATRYAPDVGWSLPTLLGTGIPTWGSTSPALAVDPQGNALVVWIAVDPGSAAPGRTDAWVNRFASPLEQQLQDTNEALAELRDALNLANESLARLTAQLLGSLVFLVALAASLAFLVIRVSGRGKSGLGVRIRNRTAPSEGPTASPRPASLQGKEIHRNAGTTSVSATEVHSAARPRGHESLPAMASMRLTAKERVLLHLGRFARYADEVEVPSDLTQEGISMAAWIDQRHFAQYVGPLERDGLVRERTAHVRNGHQRRRIYELTDSGRRVALRLVARAKSEVVQVWDGENVWDIRVGEIMEKLKGKVSVLDVARHLAEAGVVDFAALEANHQESPVGVGDSVSSDHSGP